MKITNENNQYYSPRCVIDISFCHRKLRLNMPLHARRLRFFLESYLQPYFTIENAKAFSNSFAEIYIHIGIGPRKTLDFSNAPIIDVDRSKNFLACQGKVIERGAERSVQLKPFKAIVNIDREKRSVSIHGPNEERLLIPTLRVIEDLTVLEMEKNNAVFLHASAVATRTGAVVAAGNKKAGKTTVLCRLLHGFTVRKISNDNVVVWVENDRPLVHGWPGFFKVDIATVATNEELSPFYPSKHRSLLYKNSQALWSVYDKVAFYPGQGAELFGTTIQPEAPLASIVLPRFDSSQPPTLELCDSEELYSEMSDFVQGSRHPNHPDWMGLGSESNECLNTNLQHFLKSVKGQALAYRLRWAPSVDDLLTEIKSLRDERKSLQLSQESTNVNSTWPSIPPVFDS